MSGRLPSNPPERQTDRLSQKHRNAFNQRRRRNATLKFKYTHPGSQSVNHPVSQPSSSKSQRPRYYVRLEHQVPSVKRTRLQEEAGKANFHLRGTSGDDSTATLKAPPPSTRPPPPPAPTSSTEGGKFAPGAGAQRPRPTHSEAVESPRVRHVVGSGGTDRCVVLRVPQGRRCRRRCRRGGSRAGLLGLVVVMVVLRRMVVMVRVAHARAKLCVPRTRRKLTLEQGQGPSGSRRPATPGPCTPGPCAPASGARGSPRGVQVRSDAERANAERAALAGLAAGPRHGHHQRGWHAQRDEKIWPGVRLRKRGRGP